MCVINYPGVISLSEIRSNPGGTPTTESMRVGEELFKIETSSKQYNHCATNEKSGHRSF